MTNQDQDHPNGIVDPRFTFPAEGRDHMEVTLLDLQISESFRRAMDADIVISITTCE